MPPDSSFVGVQTPHRSVGVRKPSADGPDIGANPQCQHIPARLEQLRHIDFEADKIALMFDRSRFPVHEQLGLITDPFEAEDCPFPGRNRVEPEFTAVPALDIGIYHAPDKAAAGRERVEHFTVAENLAVSVLRMKIPVQRNPDIMPAGVVEIRPGEFPFAPVQRPERFFGTFEGSQLPGSVQ